MTSIWIINCTFSMFKNLFMMNERVINLQPGQLINLFISWSVWQENIDSKLKFWHWILETNKTRLRNHNLMNILNHARELLTSEISCKKSDAKNILNNSIFINFITDSIITTRPQNVRNPKFQYIYFI